MIAMLIQSVAPPRAVGIVDWSKVMGAYRNVQRPEFGATHL
jgi:hypothetical protein